MSQDEGREDQTSTRESIKSIEELTQEEHKLIACTTLEECILILLHQYFSQKV